MAETTPNVPALIDDDPLVLGKRPERLLPSRSELNAMKEIANTILTSGMPLPKDCRTAEALFAKILAGWELGLPPMTALNRIDYIEGKASMPADVQVSLVAARKLGTIETIKSTDTQAVVRVRRAEHKASGLFEDIEFTWDDAKRAELTHKKNWRHWPRSMLLARARSLAVHTYFPEAFSACPYSPDELGAETDEAGRVIDVPFAEKPKPEWASDDGDDSKQPPPSPPVEQDFAVEQAGTDTPGKDAAPAGRGPVSPLIEDPESECKRIIKDLKIPKSKWLEIIAKFGADSWAVSSAGAQQAIAEHLVRLSQFAWLCELGNVTPEKWQNVLSKAGVTDVLDLPPEKCKQLHDVMWVKFTPFDPNGEKEGPAADPTKG